MDELPFDVSKMTIEEIQKRAEKIDNSMHIDKLIKEERINKNRIGALKALQLRSDVLEAL
jgi:hypothetical protein